MATEMIAITGRRPGMIVEAPSQAAHNVLKRGHGFYYAKLRTGLTRWSHAHGEVGLIDVPFDRPTGPAAGKLT